MDVSFLEDNVSFTYLVINVLVKLSVLKTERAYYKKRKSVIYSYITVTKDIKKKNCFMKKKEDAENFK